MPRSVAATPVEREITPTDVCIANSPSHSAIEAHPTSSPRNDPPLHPNPTVRDRDRGTTSDSPNSRKGGTMSRSYKQQKVHHRAMLRIISYRRRIRKAGNGAVDPRLQVIRSHDGPKREFRRITQFRPDSSRRMTRVGAAPSSSGARSPLEGVISHVSASVYPFGVEFWRNRIFYSYRYRDRVLFPQ